MDECNWCNKPMNEHKRVGIYSVCPGCPGPTKDYCHGTEDERAAIVAWLRSNGEGDYKWKHAAEFADAIERGDHLSRRGEDNGS